MLFKTLISDVLWPEISLKGSLYWRNCSAIAIWCHPKIWNSSDTYGWHHRRVLWVETCHCVGMSWAPGTSPSCHYLLLQDRWHSSILNSPKELWDMTANPTTVQLASAETSGEADVEACQDLKRYFPRRRKTASDVDVVSLAHNKQTNGLDRCCWYVEHAPKENVRASNNSSYF